MDFSLAQSLTMVVAVVAILTFLLNYFKDTHRIRLEVTGTGFDEFVVGVNNDSAVAFGILSVGYFDADGSVKWLNRVANYATNSVAHYPINIGPRSRVSILLISSCFPESSKNRVFCVQLETGRFYVTRNNAPHAIAIRLHAASLISRLTRGAWAPGITARPRLPTRH
jgi:hypothetical protein